MQKKRKFNYVCYFSILITMFLLLYAFLIEPNQLTVTSYMISADVAKSFRIVFFSDTHFGQYKQDNIKKIVVAIQEKNPDLIIFGGDFFNNYRKEKQKINLQLINSELKKLTPSIQSYAVFGNHDKGGGARKPYQEIMEQGGFVLLENDHRYIEELHVNIIGFDDALLGYTAPKLYDIKSSLFNIILTHEPDVIDQIKTSNHSLVLAGHSHGSQINLPYLNRYILPPLAKKYRFGVYSNLGKNNNLDLIVTKGIGTTFLPARFLAKPEIVVIDVIKNEKK